MNLGVGAEHTGDQSKSPARQLSTRGRFLRPLTLATLILLAVSPAFLGQYPLYYFEPDLEFVKAKILRVMLGDIFTDPVTNFPSFHPPYYHLFLSVFVRAGVGMDTLLRLSAVLSFGATLIFANLLLCRFWDEVSAFTVTAMVPLLIHYMGPDYPFLASSFNFALPLYLAGFWLYFSPHRRKGVEYGAALLVGLALLVSPVFIIFVALLLLYDLIFAHDRRRLIVLTLALITALIPYAFQAKMIYSIGLTGTGAFALWRGIPDGEWLRSTLGDLFSPKIGKVPLWELSIPAIILVSGFLGFIRDGRRTPWVWIALAAYLLTAYHFNRQYASRVLFLFALLMAGYAIYLLFNLSRVRILGYAVLAGLSGFSLVDHVLNTHKAFRAQESSIDAYQQYTPKMVAFLRQNTTPHDWILATAPSFRKYIMPNVPVHGLLAHRSGEYFQLSRRMADEMVADYEELFSSLNPAVLDYYCIKYNFRYAIVNGPKELFMPLFMYIHESWPRVFENDQFYIFRRP